ncbi:MAG: hypothetical protein IKR56_05915 [Lachnospiraceae bacterium]|nr:hypothetical protein [Lachnospiraceae bacterium]
MTDGFKNLIKTCRDKRLCAVTAVISALYALMLSAGYQLDTKGAFYSMKWLCTDLLLFFVPVFIISTLIFGLLKLHGKKAKDPQDGSLKNSSVKAHGKKAAKDHAVLSKNGSYKKSWIDKRLSIDWIIIFVCWIPIWLAAWPGFFCYDQSRIYKHFVNHTISTQHSPLLYFTEGLFIDVFYKLTGSYNAGIAAYVGIQMLIISFCLAFMLHYFRRRRGIKGAVLNILTAYYALFPVISLFSCCTVKDTFFGISTAMTVLFLYHILINPEEFFKSKLEMAGFIVLTTFMMLCRSNARPALILAVPFICLAVRKGYKKYAFGLLILTLIINVLIVSVGYSALQLKRYSGKDAFCAPIQMVARAYTVDPSLFTEEETEFLKEFYGEGLYNYCPVSANGAKGEMSTQFFNAHKKEFLKIWAKVLIKAPRIAAEGFFSTNLYQWYPYGTIDAYQRLDHASYEYDQCETSYFACYVEGPGSLDSKIPALYNLLWKISRFKTFQKIPVVRLFFAPAFMLWILIFTMAYLFYQKKYRLMAALMLPLLICSSYFLGPSSLVRYYLYLFYLMGFFTCVSMDVCEQIRE